jgi:wobble nucleotide-excising tRNase
MIESIEIKKVASFDETGITVNNLKKVNFIYGTNASGKTTISNLITNPADSDFSNCTVNWIHSQPLQALVYNTHFRNSNFSGSSKLQGVFTLGQATKEDIDLIELKKNELTILKDETNKQKGLLIKQQYEKAEKETDFKETCWNFYKRYEKEFKEAFIGFIKKDSFKNKLLTESKNNTYGLLTIEDIKNKSKTIFGNAPKAMPLINTICFDRITEIENEEIWKKKIIGKSDVDIATLIQNLNINDWVNQGRDYLQKDETCPFCQQKTITIEFKKKLEDYFDVSFTTSIKLIKDNYDEYNLLATNISNELSQIESNEKANLQTKLDVDKYTAYLKTLSSQFIANERLLNSKTREPSRNIDLISTKEQLENINKLITDTNEEIKKHNNIVTNFQTERANLIHAIWKFVTEEAKHTVATYTTSVNGLQKGIENIKKLINEKETAYDKLDNEIKVLNRNVTSIQPTIDEINKTLQYYGFYSFEIKPSPSEKGYYQIQRDDGTLAESTLSEGEITFITFLYFLQLTKGATNKEAITEDRVLIIDDPISSLDSNVLFIVSALIKEIIKNIKNNKGSIKQLILLTHNVYFHKEVSFIDGKPQRSNATNFWILRKNKKITSIQSYEMKNPIKSSYNLLWQEINNRDENSGITIQNTMRRIIENYFKVLGRYGDDDLIQKFKDKEEQIICRSLISWINDGSHSFSDDLFIEAQDDIIEKYLTVFKGIFEKTDNLGHYKMMMNVEDSII